MRDVTLILVVIALGRISETLAQLAGVGRIGEWALFGLMVIAYTLLVKGTVL